MSNNGLSVAGCFQDVKSSVMSFHGLRIETLEEISLHEKCINVFIGHELYDKKIKLEKNPIVNKIYYLLNPVVAAKRITTEYFKKHQVEYENAYQLFSDELSKSVFEAFINTEINQKLDYLLSVYDSRFYGKIGVDVFDLTNQEDFLDIGAYNGNYIKTFLKNTNNQYRHIYAVEADEENCNQIKDMGLSDLSVFNIAAWDRDGKLYFYKNDVGGSGNVTDNSDEASFGIDVATVDSLIGEESISFINLNMTGSLKEVIRGAEKVISKNKPKMVISAALNEKTLYEIPVVIKNIRPDCQLYLRFIGAVPARLYLFVI